MVLDYGERVGHEGSLGVAICPSLTLHRSSIIGRLSSASIASARYDSFDQKRKY